MVRIENGVIYLALYGKEENAIGNIAEAEVADEYMLINNNVLPLNSFPELRDAWDELYPDGKPEPIIEVQPKVVTEEEKALDFLKIVAYAMNNDELLKTLGIEPRGAE